MVQRGKKWKQLKLYIGLFALNLYKSIMKPLLTVQVSLMFEISMSPGLLPGKLEGKTMEE